ncbi:MAG: autotransporter-associated beta strand repeat-containing protein, partial [Chloroflexota bacterium]
LQSDLVLEKIFLNGDGININGHNTGALRNVSNSNTFTGQLVLATNSTIGVDSGSQLTIGTKTGLPDLGAGSKIDDGAAIRTLTKELTGTLVLNNANTYDGLTDVLQGALRVENPTALGPTTSAGTQVRNGAQLQVNKDVNGANITIAAEHLDLSGTGIFGTGAVLAYGGDNTWQGTVSLRAIENITAPPPAQPPNHIAFGANNNTSLAFDNTIDQVAGPAPLPALPYGVDKVGLGRIIFRANDTYGGPTIVYQGALNIQNAGALGTSGSAATGTVVQSGAALELQGPASPGGINPFNNEFLTLNGAGIANTGALRNVQGDNRWQGPVTLQSTSAIGADGGTNLTITGAVSDPNATGPAGGDLHKVGQGRLIFPNANTYRGKTLIDEGVLNIRNSQSLGVANEVQTVTVTGVAGSFTLTFEGPTTGALP